MLIGGTNKGNKIYSLSFLSEQWTLLEDLPYWRHYHGSVKVKDSLYILGGNHNTSIDRFDLNTRNFSTVNSLDEYRRFFGVCQYDENYFMFAGGFVNYRVLTNTCYLYNVTTNLLKEVSSLNIEKGSCSN